MPANNSCRCAYPRCICPTEGMFCFNNVIIGFDERFGPLPSQCLSSHPFLEMTSCSGNSQTINFGFGNNNLSSLDPFVTSGCGCEVYVVLPPCTVLRFTYNEETEVYEGEAGYCLVYRNNEFSLVNDSGERWFFRGFDPDEPNPGRFAKGPAANGSRNSLEAFDPDNPGGNPYTASGSLKGLRVVETVDNVEITYAYVFEYNADGNMTVATIKRKEDSGAWENLHRVLFTYYSGGSSSSSSSSGGSGDEYGSAGDLQSATEQIYVNSQWTGDRVSYYRYHLDGGSAGNEHQVKYILGPEEYERLAADPAVSDPFTATDAKVAEYAATYLEYDEDGEVSLRKQAGSLPTTLQTTTSDYEGTDHNQWKYKTVETRGDGGVRTRYENFRSQPLLEEFKENASATESILEYREYDSLGNLTLHATPSALESYSVGNYAITPTYKSEGGQFTVGLVHLYDYYSATTTETGGVAVAGRKQHDKIRQGRDGTPIKLRTYEYTEHSAVIVPPGATSSSSSSSSSSGGLSSEFTATIHPIAKVIEYRNEDGTGQIETSYAYQWHPGTLEMQQRVTTLPVVPVTQNGSGVAATRTERFDQYGNLIWHKDERGYITRHEYDIALGQVIQTIQDVDDNELTVPTGWSTPADGGKHVVTDYEYDELGRQTQMLGPEHSVDISGTAKNVRQANWTVYDDVNRETRSAQGYYDVTAVTYTLVNPVSIQKRNAAGTRSESIQATRASTSGKLSSSDTFAQSSYVRWAVALSNNVGQRTASRVYHTIPTSGDGSSGTNYNETTFDHDSLGRRNVVESPGGTITWNVFDKLDRTVCTYVGTNASGATDDDPSAGREPCAIVASSSSSSSSSSSGSSAAGNNMVLVSQRQYDDGGCSSCGSSGGQLTLDIQYVDASTTRITEFQYDWRGRHELVIPPADDEGRTVYRQLHYDNLDRVVKAEQYHEQSMGADILIARNETYFDDRGQVYHTRHYGVNPTNGTVGNRLASYTWFDAAGNTIKQQASGQRSFTKTAYDSLGRTMKQYVGYDLSESPCVDAGGGSSSSSSSSSTSCTDYTTATTVTGDTIFEQTETDYDDAGNVIETRLRRRHHDATGTGELTTPAGSQPRARVSYVAHYTDEAARQQATANYGTNGDVVLTRSSTVPTRSDTILVTSTEYNDVGQAFKTTDPSSKEDRTFFDDAGRVSQTIENYTNGDPTTGNADEDRTVEFTYTADGQRATITAKQQSASDDQTTTYVYGTTLDDSDIARSDLLRAEIYPDSDDVASPLGNGSDGIYDRIEYTYNRQGQRLSLKDQNGSIHEYEYNDLGRQLHDRITTLASGVDGAVRRLSTTYDVRGQIEKATSYENATVGSGNVVNEVLREYNDYGLLDREYQEHSGAKDGNTPYVGYNYDETAGGGELENSLRPTSLRYPNGRLVHYTYGSADSAADILNRLDAINDDSGGSPGGVLASYTYLGLGTVVIQDYEEPEVRLDLFGGTSGTYAGFDQFDRTVDHRWYDYGSSADVDRYKYGYDRASNRIWKENVVAANNSKDFDEFYTYDGLHRLQNFDRGALNGTNTGITGTPAKEEAWSLDPLGNWSNFVQKSGGAIDLDQEREVNWVNEITDISESTGPSWITPAYGRNGNMVVVPKPADPTISFTCTYDAWNRMVTIEESSTLVAEYAYDAVNRRVTKDVDFSARHFLYSFKGHSLEERLGSSTDPERQQLWSPQYTDQSFLRDRDTDSNSVLDERLYFIQDTDLSVVALVDTDGATVERYVYEPYGGMTFMNGSFGNQATTSVDNSSGYAGTQVDLESRLNYRQRWYYHHMLGGNLSADRAASGDRNGNHNRFRISSVAFNVVFQAQITPIPFPNLPPGICAGTDCLEGEGVVTKKNTSDPNSTCKEFCKSMIVEAHEAEHRKNMGPCCAMRNKCLQLGADEPNPVEGSNFRRVCQNVWNLWKRANRLALEELAADKSCQLAKALAEANCHRCLTPRVPSPSGSPRRIDPLGGFDPFAKMCCDNARAEENLQCAHADPNARISACPFDEEGFPDLEIVEELMKRI